MIYRLICFHNYTKMQTQRIIKKQYDVEKIKDELKQILSIPLKLEPINKKNMFTLFLKKCANCSKQIKSLLQYEVNSFTNWFRTEENIVANICKRATALYIHIINKNNIDSQFFTDKKNYDILLEEASLQFLLMLNSNKISEFKNVNLYGLIFNQSADIPDTVRLFDCIAKGIGVKVSIKNGTIKACENAIAIASSNKALAYALDRNAQAYASARGAKACAIAEGARAYAIANGAKAYANASFAVAFAKVNGAKAYALVHFSIAFSAIKGAFAYTNARGALAFEKVDGRIRERVISIEYLIEERKFRFSKSLIAKNYNIHNEVCVICLEDFENKIERNNIVIGLMADINNIYLYHIICLNLWISNKPYNPVTQKQIIGKMIKGKEIFQ